MPNLRMMEPLGYLDFLNLMANTRLVLTDSGGIQEETNILGVPCLTLRENTERPVTVTQGTNIIVGNDPERIVSEALAVLDGEGKAGHTPELRDGQSAERIVSVLEKGI
jgi:UDP-N-acetylglucosamine 2-epimerase (non-hydrolysing)